MDSPSPAASYGSTIIANDDAGYAVFGANLAIHLDRQLGGIPGLDWTLSLGISAHLVENSYADRLVAHEDRDVRPYWIAPVLAGVRYEPFTMWGALAWIGLSGGLFVVKGPDIVASGLTADYKCNFKPGYVADAGLKISERTGLGIRYSTIGRVQLEMTLGTDHPDEFFTTQVISFWDLYLTYDL